MIDPLPDDFTARWGAWYEDVPPVAFLLRDSVPERWVRIYSLPEGKRYPSSGFEHAELRRRHIRVATDVLSDGAECALLLLKPCDSNEAEDPAGTRAMAMLPRVSDLPESLWDLETGVFQSPMCLYGGVVHWHADRFIELIDAAADDRVKVMFVSLDSGRAYAPYDGGADLFYENEFARNEAAQRFDAWRSPREDGL